jgi:hypothetical protein
VQISGIFGANEIAHLIAACALQIQDAELFELKQQVKGAVHQCA